MRNGFVLISILLAALCLLAASRAPQEKVIITVTGSETSNGVAILHIVKENKHYDLQCNADIPGCTTQKSGNYQIIELPKGFGMYDCRDVEVYPDASSPDNDKKIGEYCMVEK